MSEKRQTHVSNFADSYKRKNNVIGSRASRAHRRSIEWKGLRDEEVNKRRNIGKALSPLKEEKPKSKPKKEKETAGSRRERLAKWKADRELKKKVDAEKKVKKPGFKVSHLPEKQVALKDEIKLAPLPKVKGLVFPDVKAVVESKRVMRSRAPAPKAAAPTTKPSKRVTRSSVSSAEPTKPSRNTKTTSVSSRSTRSTAASKTTPAATKKSTAKGGKDVLVGKPAASRTAKGKANHSKLQESNQSKVDNRFVTHRGESEQSFAPMDFVFTAPENIKSFTFKAMSPKSATAFLYPSMPGIASPLPRRCSTPKVSGFGSPKVIHSPGTSMIVETKESSESETEQPAEAEQNPNTATSSEAETASETEETSATGSQRSQSQISASPMLRRSSEIIKGAEGSDPEPVSMSSRSSRRKSRVQQLLSEESDASSTGDGHSSPRRSCTRSSEESDPAESEVRSARRKSRVQQLTSESSSQVENKNSGAPTTPVNRRKSTRVTSDVSHTPGSRRMTRRSIALVSDQTKPEELATVANTPAKKSRGSVAKAVSEDEEVDRKSEAVESVIQEVDMTSEAVDSVMPEPTEGWQTEETKDMAHTETNQLKAQDYQAIEEHEDLFGPLQTPTRPIPGAKRGGSLSADRCFARPGAPVGVDHNQSLKLFRTPASVGRRPRLRSEIPVNMTPAGSSPWRRTDLRNSFVLKGLSPEDCVEVLKSSPMVEMKRRTPKVVQTPAPVLDFDDVEELMLSMEEELHSKPEASEQGTADTSETGEAMETQSAVTEDVSDSSEPCGPKQEAAEPMEATASAPVGGSHGVPYFRDLLKSETERLNALSDQWNTINDTTTGLTEDVCGQLRTVVGQAQLLIAQRFLQFSGLVDDCEFQRGEKETTCTDLQGFWDMIYFQVEDVDAKFAELNKMREDGWKRPEPEIKKVIKKKPVTSKAKSNKPAGRSKFAEFRARLAAQKATEAAAPVIIVEGEEETKTFDAGFFAVSSPVRCPKLHTGAGHSPALHVTKTRRSLIVPSVQQSMDVEKTSAETNAAASEVTTAATEPVSSAEAPHDVHYFRNLLKSETERLNKLSDQWNLINDSAESLHEDVRGQLRTVVGQAQLLIAQRFLQFSGLVDDCEFQRGEKETTCTDLQGFWDMIYFQVEDVDAKFAELDKLREAGWKRPEPEVKKVIKKKPAKPKARASKPVGHSKFAEFRARMAAQKTAEAAVPVVSVEEDTKTFDAGFFAVSSPVRSPKPHCELLSPARGRLSLATTPACSPVMKAVLERNARRSVGRMSLGYLLAPSVPSPVSGGLGLPGHLSGTPPASPLVADGDQTPRRSPFCDTASSLFTPDGTAHTPGSVRRSTRKSVRLNLEPEEFTDNTADENPLLKFLEPTMSEGCMDTMAEAAPHDAHLDPEPLASAGKTSNTPKLARGRRSLSTSERRRKRHSTRRSVHFAVNDSPSRADHTHAPGTPFNRDSLVPRRRRSSSRSSINEDVSQKENLLFTPPEDTESFIQTPSSALSKLSMDTTPQRQNKRISGLGFTPPQALSHIQPLAPVAEDSFSNLMVFSPISSLSPAGKVARRKSMRSRPSLL